MSESKNPVSNPDNKPGPRRTHPGTMIAAIILGILIGASAFYSWLLTKPHHFTVLDFFTSTIFGILTFILLIPAHCFILLYWRRATTHTVRDFFAGLIIITVVLPNLFFGIVFFNSKIESMGRIVWGDLFVETAGALALVLSAIVALISVLIMMHPLQALSIPSSRLSIIPLILSYLSIWNPLNIMVGFWFPVHRRLKYFWKPETLPRLGTERRGMTLIEILIIMAIMSILAVSVAHVSAVVLRTAHSQQTWVEAMELAQDEIAMLRAGERLPDPGVHPIHEEVADLHSQPGQNATVEIGPGGDEGVRQVRVTVRINNEFDRREVSLAALLPAVRVGRGVAP